MELFRDGWTKEDVENIMQRGNPEEILYIPIIISVNVKGCGREWVENICIELAAHSNFNVRGNAILAFGHIARLSGELNVKQILPIVEKAMEDEYEYVRTHAEAAACDFENYLNISMKKAEL